MAGEGNVADESQGVPLATMQELARYWATDHDWRKAEAKLNAYPQFITNIDGLDIHFIHVKSKEKNALPLVINHGWPGSVLEQVKLIGPLTDPIAHGGKAEDAFDVVIPSMPGYGFSGKPTGTGWGPERMARAWDVLMKRLGYTRYVAQGGDWGAFVVDQMALQAPPGLLAIHTNMPAVVPADVQKALDTGSGPPAGLSADERRAYDQLVRTFKQVDLCKDHGIAAADLYGLADSRSSSPPGCSTITMPMASRRRRSRRACAGRQARRRADAGRNPRQHHALLADQHGRLLVAALLGIQGRLLQRQRRQDPGRGDRLPERAI